MSAATPAPSPNPPPAKPKRRLLKWGLVGVLAAGSAVAGAPWLISSSWMNDVIRAWLKENVERDVDFKTVEVTWSEGVRITGLVVHDELAGQPPVLEAPSIVLRAPILPMLWREFDVQEFAFDDAVVRIAQRDDGVNAGKVVRKRKVKKQGPAPAPAPDGAPAEEPTAFPEMDVPIRIRNLTLVLSDDQGKEVRRPGVAFRGHVSTRARPSTFLLDIPTSGNGNVHFEGEAVLFDEQGVQLGVEAIRAVTRAEIRNVDAQANSDILRLVLPGKPLAGVLDAVVDGRSTGGAMSGKIDLHLRGVATGAAVGTRPAATGDDLTVTGAFDLEKGRMKFDGLKVRAEGLALDADLAGSFPNLDGKVTLDADLARMSRALANFGFELGESVEGTAKGDVTFTSAPALGKGRVTFAGLRATSTKGGHPPVAIDRAEVSFTGAPDAGGFRLDTCDLALAELTAHLSGKIGGDGALDLRTEARGNLGALLDRGRDLGLLPSGFSVRGTLDSAVAVKGPANALTFDIGRLTFSEDDAKVEITGKATAGGEVDLAAHGSGDLGKLLGRAQQAGVKGPGLDAVGGRFAFEASAKGAKDAVVVRVPKFRLDGALAVDASGEWDQRGPVAGQVHVDGKIDDALLLARRLGFLEGDGTIDGTLRADATVAAAKIDVADGKGPAFSVPSFSVATTGTTLNLTAAGSMDEKRSVRAAARGTADLARLAAFAKASKLAPQMPPVRGTLAFDAEAAGPADRLALPRFSASLRGGPATADVKGSITDAGVVTGTLDADGALAELCAYAREAGWLAKPLSPAGRATVHAPFSGSRDAVQVKDATVTVTGLIETTLTCSLAADRSVRAAGDFRGTLQPLLDAASQWTGEPSRRVDGSLQGRISVEGPMDALTAELPSLTVRGGALEVVASGRRDGKGNVVAKAGARGPVADLLAIVRAFGQAADVEAAGLLDASLDAKLEGGRATGSVSATVTNLDVAKPEVGGAPFRDPRVAFSAPNFVYDLNAGKLEPLAVTIELDGAKVATTVSMEEGPPAKDFTATRIVRAANGTLDFGEAFVRNHEELLSGATFRRISGPFAFAGDVSHGRDNAAAWTGGGELTIENMVAPHVVADRAHAKATLAGGVLTLDPIEGVVNGGTVTGKASLGLVGERPAHSFDLTGKDVALSGDLAPLVARASPLFAVGEHGKTGGKAGLDMHLEANGMDLPSIRQSLTGNGKVALKDAFVESGDWVGMLLSLVGSSGRLDLSPVDVPFDVANGRVKTGDLAMQGVGLLLRMAGEVGLDGKIDYKLLVKPTSASSTFDKYASFLDESGYLPLALKGNLTKPKLRAPDLKDVLRSKLDDLLGGKKDEKDDPPPPAPEKPKGGKKKKAKEGEAEEPPPPPPPAKHEEDPPPPPPPPK